MKDQDPCASIGLTWRAYTLQVHEATAQRPAASSHRCRGGVLHSSPVVLRSPHTECCTLSASHRNPGKALMSAAQQLLGVGMREINCLTWLPLLKQGFHGSRCAPCWRARARMLTRGCGCCVRLCGSWLLGAVRWTQMNTRGTQTTATYHTNVPSGALYSVGSAKALPSMNDASPHPQACANTGSERYRVDQDPGPDPYDRQAMVLECGLCCTRVAAMHES